MMCYGYGLKESEVDNASPRFLSLFLRGNIEGDNERIKTAWEQARFIASTMSKEAGSYKFPWEKKKLPKSIYEHIDWSKFTIDKEGVKVDAKGIEKILNGGR
jgi:hypothetical protein